MEILLGWFVFAVIVAVAATARGRFGAGWFFLAVIISPLLALIALLVMPNLANPPVMLVRPADTEDGKICPRCAETVKRAAFVCRYCGHEFGEEPEQTEPEARFYRGVPYTLHPDGGVEVVISGRPQPWPSEEILRADIDRGRLTPAGS